ncbi:MAG: PEP-CTERM sorting domain-containing protein [Desulfocapsaceae bacterium]|nr:PEP-CTERM sorting domain-containing protein [Desulfocapsaceae bacterium]
MRKKLLASTLMLGTLIWCAPAQAVTFDFSTLNTSTYRNRGFIYYNPAYDPVSGTEILNSSFAQVGPWTEGTGAGAATIEFQSTFGQGNNSSKIYLTAGGPFSLPGTNGVPALSGTETTLGTSNSLYSGDYATSNSMPLYFLFVTPGSTPTPGPATLNSLSISGASTNLEIVGLNGTANTGGTVIDSQQVTANSGVQHVTLNWQGVTEVEILSAISGSNFGYGVASGFYVNDIEVNDPMPTPEPTTMLLLGSGLAGLAGFRLKTKKKV